MARMRLETALREAKPALMWTEVEQAVQSEPVGRAAQEPVWQRARLETEQPAQLEAEQAVQPQPGANMRKQLLPKSARPTAETQVRPRMRLLRQQWCRFRPML